MIQSLSSVFQSIELELFQCFTCHHPFDMYTLRYALIHGRNVRENIGKLGVTVYVRV